MKGLGLMVRVGIGHDSYCVSATAAGDCSRIFQVGAKGKIHGGPRGRSK